MDTYRLGYVGDKAEVEEKARETSAGDADDESSDKATLLPVLLRTKEHEGDLGVDGDHACEE